MPESPVGIFPGCLPANEFPGRCTAVMPGVRPAQRCMHDAGHDAEHFNIDGDRWPVRRAITLPQGMLRRIAELRKEA